MEISEISLRNGTTAPNVLVRTTYLCLQRLLDTDPIAFYEFSVACRDESRVLSGRTGQQLKDLVLTDHLNGDGTAKINQAVRNIVWV